MFVYVVHPVAILSAVCCVICSLLMFVSDANGDHMLKSVGDKDAALCNIIFELALC